MNKLSTTAREEMKNLLEEFFKSKNSISSLDADFIKAQTLEVGGSDVLAERLKKAYLEFFSKDYKSIMSHSRVYKREIKRVMIKYVLKLFKEKSLGKSIENALNNPALSKEFSTVIKFSSDVYLWMSLSELLLEGCTKFESNVLGLEYSKELSNLYDSFVSKFTMDYFGVLQSHITLEKEIESLEDSEFSQSMVELYCRILKAVGITGMLDQEKLI